MYSSHIPVPDPSSTGVQSSFYPDTPLNTWGTTPRDDGGKGLRSRDLTRAATRDERGLRGTRDPKRTSNEETENVPRLVVGCRSTHATTFPGIDEGFVADESFTYKRTDGRPELRLDLVHPC